jgi:alcohol dehydrogenase class IV
VTAPSGVAPFDLALDTQVFFGAGRRREIGSRAAGFGRRAALVTGAASFDGSPLRGDILDALASAGVAVVTRLRQTGEPTDADVRAGADDLLAHHVDVVVAVGGGSTIDLAKAASIVAGGGNLDALLGGETVDRHVGPSVIALPTTAGSGSEVSRGAIVLHRGARRKRGIRGRGVAAQVAVVDPELGHGAGARVTAEAGFDAVAHAIETAVSRVAQPLTMALSAEALRHLLLAVPRAVDHPDDAAAREENASAALLMGLNLATSTTCLPHRLQYPVGALTGVSHARGVAAIMPAWLRRTSEIAPQALAQLARRAGVADSEIDREAARQLEVAIRRLQSTLGLDQGLSTLGVGGDDIDGLVAAVEGTLSNDPGPTDPLALTALYRESL